MARAFLQRRKPKLPLSHLGERAFHLLGGPQHLLVVGQQGLALAGLRGLQAGVDAAAVEDRHGHARRDEPRCTAHCPQA